MGRRFAIVIGAAAACVMALGAQTAAAAPDVVKYDTKLTITTDRGFLYHGWVQSDRDHSPGYDPANAVRKCMEGRRVILLEPRPGADRRIATVRSQFRPDYGQGIWGMPRSHARAYAKVTPKVRDRFVCRGDRSERIGVRGLAATSTTRGKPVDRVPPDLQLSGPKKQSPTIPAGTDCAPEPDDIRCRACDRGACSVKVKVSCGDQACTARAEGTLTTVKNDELGEPWSADVDPGETKELALWLKKKTRTEAGEALAEGKQVKAKVTVAARDAAGNVATAKRTVTLVRGAPSSRSGPGARGRLRP